MTSSSTEPTKTLLQCDFDGTITEKDVSFLMLDAFADGDWKELLAEYRAGRLLVGDFNTRVFAMIKQDRQTLVNFTRQTARVRAGFHELIDYCRQRGFRFTIVSNGLDFYIDTILADAGVEGIDVFAAQTKFAPGGLQVKYIGPDGTQLRSDFKEIYARTFLSQGYRVIYLGDGLSDMAAARHARHIFARHQLLDLCQQTKLNFTPFTDLHDVVRVLELLKQGLTPER